MLRQVSDALACFTLLADNASDTRQKAISTTKQTSFRRRKDVSPARSYSTTTISCESKVKQAKNCPALGGPKDHAKEESVSISRMASMVWRLPLAPK